MVGPNTDHLEYLCQPCRELWGIYLKVLTTHGRKCVFDESVFSKVQKIPHQTRYCSCDHSQEYQGSRTKAVSDSVDDLDCPLCAFIWHTVYSIRAKASRHLTAGSLKRPIEETIHFDVVLNVPYNRSVLKFKEFGQCQFRLYETIQKPHLKSAQSQAWSDDPGPKHWKWLTDRGDNSSFFSKHGQILSSQLAYCQKHHVECRSTQRYRLPSRLLQLDGTYEAPRARLVSTADFKLHPRYTTLSYCWGPMQPLITQQDNLNDHLDSVDVNKLSATVLDAIKLTLSAGFAYLWVDALCIVQDSNDDKNTELLRMGEIYSGAVCTFSIASAESSLDGFASSKLGCERVIFETAAGSRALIEICSDDETDLVKEAIHHRGWTLQETLLSPRLATILSNGRGVHLRCRVEAVTSNGCEILRLPPLIEGGLSAATHEYFVEQDSQLPWFDVVMEYSKREFTHRTDKFPAMAAIAAVHEERGKLGSYVAGIFTGNLCWDLLWSSQDTLDVRAASGNVEPREPEDVWLAPTWSWASRKHSIHYSAIEVSNRSRFESSQCILDAKFETEPVSDNLPNDKLKKATLTLRCYSWKLTWGEYNIIARIFLDDHPCTLQRGDEIWFVHVANEAGYDDMTLSNGLILKEVHDSCETAGNAVGVFKRVGMYLCGPRSYFVHHEQIIPEPFSGFQKEIQIIKPNTFKII